MIELRDIDLVWLLICTVLVALMQAGFLCLESGAVRQKNSVSVAVKNLLDLCLSGLLFWLVGHGILYGPSLAGGFIGWAGKPGVAENVSEQARFIYMLMFCGTAVTIVSGAVAERIRLHGYLLIAVIVSVTLFPVIGHWVWADSGWLAQRGFVDFAGGTVVHVTGGLTALMACLVVGPRIGRFQKDAVMPASNLTLTALGTLLLWIGWFGFNGGSYLAFDGGAVSVLLNTAAGGIAGAGAAVFISMARKVPLRVETICTGLVGGLVGITASAHALTPAFALSLGCACGLLAIYGQLWIARFGIDDVIGAIAAHALAGIAGTLLLPLVADLERLGTGLTALEQLQIQSIGVVATAAWVLAVGGGLIWLCDRLYPLRCSEAQEIDGLDRSEHAASNAWIELGEQLRAQRQGESANLAPSSDEAVNQVASEFSELNTELRTAERERKAAQDARARADAANAAKGAFIANMSHELRTPLNGVIGTLDTVLDDALDPELADNLAMAKTSGEHLLALINDLLDVAKFEAGEIELAPIPVNVRVLVNEVRQTLSHVASAKALELTATFASDVPTFALLDPTRTRQVLLNLVGNAVKFTGEGAVTVQVGCQWQAQDNRCELAIAVTDTGPGIPEALQQTIFERFKQADVSTTREFGGTGLGLALTRDLIELMDGLLSLESTPGVGACFTVHLPVQVVHESDATQAPMTVSRSLNLADVRILVAEDNPVNQVVVQRMLTKLGAGQVDLASNGAEAVAQWREGGYQVVLMDCQMPQMDGLEATAAIRDIELAEQRVPVPIVACTANASRMDREECIKAGMDLHLAKPLKLAKLLETLETALSAADRRAG